MLIHICKAFRDHLAPRIGGLTCLTCKVAVVKTLLCLLSLVDWLESTTKVCLCALSIKVDLEADLIAIANLHGDVYTDCKPVYQCKFACLSVDLKQKWK